MEELSSIITYVVDQGDEKNVEKDIISEVCESETKLSEYVVDEIYKIIFKVIANLVPEFVEITDEDKKNIAMDNYLLSNINKSKDNLRYNLLPLLSHYYGFEQMLRSDMESSLSATLSNIIKFVSDNGGKVTLPENVKKEIEKQIKSACDAAIKEYEDYISEVKKEEGEEYDSSWGNEKIAIVKAIKEDPTKIMNGIIDNSLSYVITSITDSNVFEYNDEIRNLVVEEIFKRSEDQSYTTDDIVTHIKKDKSLKNLFIEVPEDEFMSFARVFPSSQKH